jgi:hypothetical protein
VAAFALAAAGGYLVSWWLRGAALDVELAGGGTLDAQVLVDGIERCSRLPCRIEKLEAGARRVRVLSGGEVVTEIDVALGAHDDERLALALASRD